MAFFRRASREYVARMHMNVQLLNFETHVTTTTNYWKLEVK